ncbi:MAG TPA: ABC transporter ATP-binding protein [Acidimicrobiales bacterium]|nr:ABC transporter ATP-binding protein [Acidimicrobiales bacterium]
MPTRVGSGRDGQERRRDITESPAADEGMIVLREVAKRFETPGGTVVALDRATLSMAGSQLIVVLGPSGSGKTTLLNVIGALDTPSEGTVEVAGKSVTGLRRAELFEFRRHTVSFVFQAFNLFPELTALENVRFGAEVAGRRSATELAVRMLDDVDLGHRLRHFPHELSGGEQQRVAIARSLATGNPVILADEPTGELDYRTGIQVLRLLRDRAAKGQTVVVVTHNREIARMADLVVELSNGRVVGSAAPVGGPVDVAELRW